MVTKVASESSFDVVEHVIPCQHLRGYPRAVKNPTAVLKLAVKQYIPVSYPNTAQNGITIIATHAIGIVKVGATAVNKWKYALIL